ncbi:sodium channel protein type 2 subunit alpha-like [Takifugu rubripes]|uniref:sodium channel protein type 2 subunit alpha-like n=1 Tax=Takifugu rubripes TaxID=31033 RepID=UPI001145A8F8|nr:sodium channel protein type 2 subunit alpha-like [Takifugu rubripes]
MGGAAGPKTSIGEPQRSRPWGRARLLDACVAADCTMTRKTSFLEFWRSKRERAACLRRAKGLRLRPAQLKQLRDDGAVREALKGCRTASLLPPVGTDFLRPLTSASLGPMNQRVKRQRQKGNKDEQRVTNNDLPQPSPELEEGRPLPYIFGEPSAEHLNTPLEELDPYHQSEKTFLVLGKGKVIHRFNAHKACYLFGPLNPLRTLAIKILTNSLFSALMFVTILLNYVVMVTLRYSSPLNLYAGMAFPAVFMLEVLVKILSRGLCIGKFTFLRNPWNWPDVTVIAAPFLSLFVHLPMLLEVSLLLKMIPIFPGLKKMLYHFVQSVKRLSCVLILTAFMLCIFATVGLQSFMGNLRQKCISTSLFSQNRTSDIYFTSYYVNESTAFNYQEYITDPDNIYFLPGSLDALVCGNSSDAGTCPEGYMCIRAGRTPNYSYTSYDTFGWSLLSSFRLLTQEYWENLMQLVLRSAGKFSLVHFLFFVSPGCFVLVSLIVAVAAAAVCELEQLRAAEASRKEKEFRQIVKALKRREDEEAAGKAAKSEGPDEDSKKSQEQQQTGKEAEPQTSGSPRCSAAAAQLLLRWNCCGCWRWLKQRVRTIVTNPFFDLGIVVCIVIDVLFMAMEHFPMTEEFQQTLTCANLVFTCIYTVEMVIKIVAMDPYGYFKVRIRP